MALSVQDPNQPSLLQSILTPMDEVDFWAEMASRGGPAAKVAQQVRGVEQIRNSSYTSTPCLFISPVTPPLYPSQVHLFLEPLRPALEGLALGEAEGGWEGIKEVVEQLLQALRQASADCKF